jgi:hypothetical protein
MDIVVHDKLTILKNHENMTIEVNVSDIVFI